jgi:hypothetical protein
MSKSTGMRFTSLAEWMAAADPGAPPWSRVGGPGTRWDEGSTAALTVLVSHRRL